MSAASPTVETALAAYRAAFAGPGAALPRDPDGPVTLEDRGSLLNVVIGPLRSMMQVPGRRSLLAGIPTRHALPLTAASGC